MRIGRDLFILNLFLDLFIYFYFLYINLNLYALFLFQDNQSYLIRE